MTAVPITVTFPPSRSRRTPFARVLLRAERERFSWARTIHCAHGRLGHRPVRRVSDCEVLAALVPERVLPFASGDSRKRGPSRAEGKNLGECRGGAPKGERACSMRSRRPRSSRSGKTGERACAASFDAASVLVRFSALRLPSCLEAILSWRSLFRIRSHFSRERKHLSFAR